MFNKKFILDLAERIVANAAGAGAGLLGGSAINLFDVNAKLFAGTMLGAGLFSLLKGLAARKSGDENSAGFIG